jgi:hypothetical protein
MLPNPLLVSNVRKTIDKAVSEAVGAEQVGSMAAILEESTEEDNYKHDETVTDTLAVQRDKWSSLEIIKMLAKGGGKEDEEDAAQFLFAYNVALSADPTMYEKMKISNGVSPADCANSLVKPLNCWTLQL